MKTSVQTLRWVDDHLEMIDQRVLPSEFRYLAYRTAEEVAQGIRLMVVRGAPAIGCAAAYGVALEALALKSRSLDAFHAGMTKAFEVLAESRPTAVNLFWALNRMKAHLASAGNQAPNALAQALLVEAHAVFDEDIAVNKAMGAHGAALLKDGDRVLTHCNAGALATAGHGTALGVFRSAVSMGKKIEVIADETRPLSSGGTVNRLGDGARGHTHHLNFGWHGRSPHGNRLC